MLYSDQPQPPSTEYESISIGDWYTRSDVDTFFTQHTPQNGFAGIKMGNYVTIHDGTYNTQWEVAGFNLEHNATASDGTVYNNGYGIMWIPKTNTTDEVWHTSNDISGGYISSYIHLTGLNTNMYNAMSPILGSHLIQRNVLLSSATATSGSYYYSSAYTWTTAYFTLMSIGQMSGTFASHKNIYDDGEANYVLPVFNFETYAPVYEILTRGIDMGSSRSASWCYCMDGEDYPIEHQVTYEGTIRPLMYLR